MNLDFGAKPSTLKTILVSESAVMYVSYEGMELVFSPDNASNLYSNGAFLESIVAR